MFGGFMGGVLGAKSAFGAGKMALKGFGSALKGFSGPRKKGKGRGKGWGSKAW